MIDISTLPIQPKGPGSPKLRMGRYQLDVARPSTRREGAHNVHTTLRFASLKGAMKVADAIPATEDNNLVNVTYYGPADGWQPQAVAQRRGGVWTARPEGV